MTSLPVSVDLHQLAIDKKSLQTAAQPLRDLFVSSTKSQPQPGEKEALQARLKTASSYPEWLATATRLDQIEGNDVWKADPESDSYNFRLLQDRLRQLREAKEDHDVAQMLFLVRTTFSRNASGMGNLDLYCHSRTGTKRLIEDYIDECLDTIDYLLSEPHKGSGPTRTEILDALVCTRQTYGRTALLLSGGATFGMNHVGVMQALYEANLLPRIVSGASAGSIVAAVVCTRTDEEIPHLLETFAYGDLNVFDDRETPESILQHLARFLKEGAWMDSKHIIRVLKGMMGDATFQDAYNRTRKVLNICVSSTGTFDVPRILNYITAPNVIIWSAVAASCSLPLLFTPAPLLAKDPRTGEPVPWNPTPQKWMDGSVDNDLPITRLSEMFNVNHFIVSQVNPHVVPFLSDADYESPPLTGKLATWGKTAARLAVSESMHRMSMLAEIGVLRTPITKLKSMLTQRYSGDITILPEIKYSDLQRILANPTPEFMIKASLCGQRATWPKISRIQSHCAIELAIDRAIAQLRTKIVFSPSQSNLRQIVSTSTRAKRRRTRTGDGCHSQQPRSYSHRGLRATASRPRSFSKTNSDISFDIAPSSVQEPETLSSTPVGTIHGHRARETVRAEYCSSNSIGNQSAISLLMTPSARLTPPSIVIRRQSDSCLRTSPS